MYNAPEAVDEVAAPDNLMTIESKKVNIQDVAIVRASF